MRIIASNTGKREDTQRILVLEQSGRAEKKIRGIAAHGNGCFEMTVYSIADDLPEVIDDGRIYLPEHITADLVLDYLKHPDLSYDLARMCHRLGITVVASAKKIRSSGVLTPPVCCALPQSKPLGLYGERFGLPELDITTEKGVVTHIKVRRGAPCGATWGAAAKVIGLPCETAAIRMGLEVQFLCSADPAGWDPIHGKSPVHLAGHLHRTAFLKAVS